MTIVKFKDYPDTSTKINAENLNTNTEHFLEILLWENPNPDNPVATGAITLTSDDYDYLKVVWKRTVAQNFITVSSFVKGSRIDLFQSSTSNANIYVRNRILDFVDETTYTINTAYLQFVGSSRTEEVEGCIPLKIYGVKF